MPDVEPISLGDDFKRIISVFVNRMGFNVESDGQLPDGSLEFIATTTNPIGGKITSIIRASPYVRPVSKEDVLDLSNSMIKHGAVRAAYITTSDFSDSAKEAASELPISLISKYHILESLESRGYGWDKELVQSLEKYGLAEKYFQGAEQSFTPSKNYTEVKEYFESKGKKKNIFGKVVSADVPIKTRLRYAPVAVFKFVTVKDFWTGTKELRKVEKKDYLFLNLNNLDLYYILQQRKKNVTEMTLNASDIIRKIVALPDDSKTFLMYLLQHGDLLAEDFESVDLTILKNKKVIQTYEGDKEKPASDFTEMAEKLLEGTLETIMMVVEDIISGITTMGEGPSTKTEEEKPKKKVEAYILMPSIYGGVYDIWKYLETEKSLKIDSEVDPVVYSSNSQIPLLSAILKANVRPEGIIFLPYYRSKYMDPKSQKVTKYEILYVPKFKQEGEKEVEEKKVKTVLPRVLGKKDFAKQPYRIIK